MIQRIHRAAPLDPDRYSLPLLGRLSTPRLVVYREFVEANLRRMRDALNEVVPGSDFAHLRTHVKTHKSAWTTERMLEAGIERFKCTPHELEMLVEGGARDVFVAYPLLPREADRVAHWSARFPEVRIIAQVGCEAHASTLASAARRHGIEIPVLIDVNVGGERTGSAPERVESLARLLLGGDHYGVLQLEGIHGYDGHNHARDADERRAIAQRAMAPVVECVRVLERIGAPPKRVTVAGTPPFREDLDELTRVHRLDAHVEVSPGTWIYWDTNYDAIVPGQFELAALIIAQVMDLPGGDLVTLNLGHKRFGIDAGPPEAFSVPGLEFVSATEEHLVLRRGPETPELRVGDPVLVAPKHICSCVNLWEHFAIVGDDGRLECAAEPVTARNR